MWRLRVCFWLVDLSSALAVQTLQNTRVNVHGSLFPYWTGTKSDHLQIQAISFFWQLQTFPVCLKRWRTSNFQRSCLRHKMNSAWKINWIPKCIMSTYHFFDWNAHWTLTHNQPPMMTTTTALLPLQPSMTSFYWIQVWSSSYELYTCLYTEYVNQFVQKKSTFNRGKCSK